MDRTDIEDIFNKVHRVSLSFSELEILENALTVYLDYLKELNLTDTNPPVIIMSYVESRKVLRKVTKWVKTYG